MLCMCYFNTVSYKGPERWVFWYLWWCRGNALEPVPEDTKGQLLNVHSLPVSEWESPTKHRRRRETFRESLQCSWMNLGFSAAMNNESH